MVGLVRFFTFPLMIFFVLFAKLKVILWVFLFFLFFGVVLLELFGETLLAFKLSGLGKFQYARLNKVYYQPLFCCGHPF
jgi:hypothetical protein